MKHRLEVDIPARKEVQVVKITCDLCACDITRAWQGYAHDDITITRREGVSYPDNGSGTETEVHMCPKCWKDKFLHWLAYHGCVPEVREWEY